VNNRAWWIGILLLLALWATRLNALELLPLHNDEGLHLTRAVEVGMKRNGLQAVVVEHRCQEHAAL